MAKCLLIIILGFIFNFGYAQDVPPPPNSTELEQVIGYACYFSGTPTEIVVKFHKLIVKKRYKKIKAYLYSKKPAEKCLAALSCMMLGEKNYITLTSKEKTEIQKITNSKEQISFCSGCTVGFPTTIKEFFEQKNEEPHYLYKGVKKYLSESL